MTAGAVIHWFRQDLRLSDNRALSAAAASGRPVVPVYVLDDAGAGDWSMGGASRWWLHGSLTSLAADLQHNGSRLILRRGESVPVLMRLAVETGAEAIYLTRAYEPKAAALETELKTACDAAGIAVRRFGGSLLHEPESLRTRSGEPFRVFTPFWRSALEAPPPRPPVPPPASLPAPSPWPASDRLASWRLLPRRPDWAGGLRDTWQPGEAGASQRLSFLLENVLAGYAEERNRPDRPATSMVSPHLHFGELSPGQCWHAVSMARYRRPGLETGAASFLREIGWREFSGHLLHHWPHMTDAPFRPEFAGFPWDDDATATERNLRAWQQGRTGYPIVDAGMRQLWETGWMHNRVRMITASFLTKHLRIHWRHGARWFWDTLVDADLASNSASWQWVAGSGADAAPYFRIFNPILQGVKFDPEGAYVRQFVPELSRLPIAYVHAPWTSPPEVLANAGVQLGGDYPLPIVDHAGAREKALAAYATLRGVEPETPAVVARPAPKPRASKTHR